MTPTSTCLIKLRSIEIKKFKLLLLFRKTGGCLKSNGSLPTRKMLRYVFREYGEALLAVASLMIVNRMKININKANSLQSKPR